MTAAPASRAVGSLPAGVVFDCDGTLVDTEPLSEEAWRTVLGTRGYAPTDEDFAAVLGRPGTFSFDYFDRRAGLGGSEAFRRELREVYEELFEAGVRVFEDAVTTVHELHRLGVPVAVASSSSRRHVLRAVEVCGLADVVIETFGADDVVDHKPHPAPYLAAATALGVPPGACSAVEDSAVGIASASAAGMYTVAVRRGHAPDDDLAGADRIVDEITVGSLVPGPRR